MIDQRGDRADRLNEHCGLDDTERRLTVEGCRRRCSCTSGRTAPRAPAQPASGQAAAGHTTQERPAGRPRTRQRVGWLGLLLRWWSFATLGRYFTTVVKTSADQVVVSRGPYRALRHPSYTGLLAAFLGCGLMLGNWVGCGASFLPGATGPFRLVTDTAECRAEADRVRTRHPLIGKSGVGGDRKLVGSGA
ncbi:methyltransferase family protein [Segeticoccus rhizosphaerae]|uniref:methyltransferase family protein n=1 Tax=Segeticoccus rhizosphaerae TaxID=1104777 RepID=UPI001EE42087|nr:isoprenylcysteine carboxylmethyltransferase family protein [Ornithinicoccus soli]